VDTTPESKSLDKASQNLEDLMQGKRAAHSNTLDMQAASDVITRNVDACHHASTVFQSSYSTVISPPFAADKSKMSKKSRDGRLPGGIKSIMSRIRHADHRR
jgi:hypothetical protein